MGDHGGTEGDLRPEGQCTVPLAPPVEAAAANNEVHVQAETHLGCSGQQIANVCPVFEREPRTAPITSTCTD